MREKTPAKQGTSKKNSFLSGVLILSLSTLIVKIIGLIYKIPMLGLLGSEGMGYFNAAYELYTLFCTVATAGLPVAMAVLISSATGRGERKDAAVFRVAWYLFLVLGLLGMCLLLAFATPFASFLGERRASLSITAIAPTVLLICLTSAYRGYFQGFGDMKQTAVSQVIEALGKLLLGLFFASFALSRGYEARTVAAFAVLGLTLGTAVSLLYLALSKRLTSQKERLMPSLTERKEQRMILRALLKTALPITLSSAVVSLTKVIDMTMILRRLQNIGMSGVEAFSAYGSYTTLALPLFSLAPSLISSVSLPLIPSLSRAVAAGHREEQLQVTEKAVKLTVILSLPVSLGLLLFSDPILNLLFSGETAAIATSALPLALLGCSVTLSCLITVGNAVLQAYGHPSIPIFSMVLGSLAKLILAYFLIGNPKIGLLGAPISTFVCNLLINLINFAYIDKCLPKSLSLSALFIRPFVAACLSVTAARLAYNLLLNKSTPSPLLTLSAIALAALLYAPLLLLFGCVDREMMKIRVRN